MSNSTPPRTRMTPLARRWISARAASRVAPLRGYRACTAQLGQARPRAHADVESLISEFYGVTLGEPVTARDRLDDVVGDRRVGGQRHHRLGRARLGADGGGDDVHAVLAERRPDAADHAGLVGVAKDREVVGERHVEALAPDPDEVGHVARADAGAGDLDLLAVAGDADDDQLGEVLRRAFGRLDELDPALLRQLRGVHEVPSRLVSCSVMRPRSSTSTRPPAPPARPVARRPSFSQSGTKGASASIVSGRTATMLTALVTTPPVSAAFTCSAVTRPARSCASAVDAPRCGVTTTSSRSKIECEVKGSSGKTSRAAPATLPDSRPASSASRSISSPRAQFTIRTPSRIPWIAPASIQLIVSGVFGRWIVIRS